MKSEIIVLDKSGLQGDFVHELLLEKRVIPILPLTIVARGKPKSKLSGLKSDLVENFLEMIEDDFFIAKDLPDVDLLYEELRGYRSRKSPRGVTTTFRPHSVGLDDLIDSILITAWVIRRGWVRLYTRKPVGLSKETAKKRPISGNRIDEDYSSIRESMYC